MEQTVKRRSLGRPRKETVQDIDSEILDAAQALFAAQGFAATTIDTLVAKLQVSKHTVYRRYPDKIALLDAVANRDTERFRAMLADIQAQETPALDRLERAARAYFDYGCVAGNAVFYLVANAEAAHSEEIRERLIRWAARALEPLLALVNEAIAGKELAAGDPESAGAILVDLLEGAVTRVRHADTLIGGTTVADVFNLRWRTFLAAFGQRGKPPSRRRLASDGA
ncbi:TetR family transcriptional regulator [Sphingomonas sp. DBB INV C78]|uniref:TetR/AcrR family transcriptional regulator n=1 Tax=Sphingomonas sp. DBB INV C78 TaxID=3349434 RepID=UPI0036D23881